MQYIGLFCLTVMAVLVQGFNADTEITVRDTPGLLDSAFDDIISNVDYYTSNTTYGKNMVAFLLEMKREVSNATIDHIIELFNQGNLLTRVWKVISNSAVVGFSGTDLSGDAVKTFLEKAKASMNIFDLFSLLFGPYDNIFNKIRDAADETAKVVKIKPEVVTKVKEFITHIEDGIKIRPPQ